MFEAAELGQKVSRKAWRERVPALREALLEAQGALRSADFRVIVLIGGVDGAGKGDLVNTLGSWMDPRWMVTHAFERPTQEERERPEYWRFWRALPAKGRIGVFLSAWYSKPLLRRAHGVDDGGFEEALDEIVAFERLLTDDGAVVLKFWLHLGRDAQKARFRRLEKDPLQRWRVTERDWEHWRMYDRFEAAAERIIVRTSTGDAPWHLVEAADPRFASLRVAETLLASIQQRARERLGGSDDDAAGTTPPPLGQEAAAPAERPVTVLSKLDLSLGLPRGVYRERLARAQGRLNQLQRAAREAGVSTVLVFEGWDAAGKGGTIRRINAALDTRGVEVFATAGPTEEERGHHYLWRFWRRLPRAGRIAIFDRSWFGRVLVERVEGYASEREWRRAYAEINLFEHQLVRHGMVLLKFFLHISPEEQLRRFRERERTPYKRWKITSEDWRNRERWTDYERAVHDMVERTSTRATPWVLVEANDKPWARVRILERVCEALEQRLDAKASLGEAPEDAEPDAAETGGGT